MFIGRKKELEEIENLISTSKFEFALIYGRRQIGKTTILQKIIKKYKGFYFVADRSGLKANLKRLSREITNFLKESDILFDNFYDLFEFIVKRVNKKKLIFVIDEFSYLIDSESSFLTILQNIVDHKLNQSNIKLFISGSHMSLMEQMDNYNQALFGRVTYKKKIKPFSYLEASLFYPNANYKDKIRFYSVFGGLPLYLNKIDKNKSIKENIMKICIPNIDSIENEIYTNLMQEIRLPAPYLNILDVMSDKKEIKLSKISQKIEENTSKTSYYLKKMSNLEIIDKNICFGEKENPKKTFYHIKDQFLKFYYRFIKQYYRHQYMYDNKEDFYNKTIEPFLEIFISWEFEKICKDFLIYKYRGETSRFISQRKNINIEIDLLCRTKEGIKAFECKWGPEINNEHIYALKNKIEQITNIHPIHQIGFFAKKKPLSNICQNCLYFEPKNLFE